MWKRFATSVASVLACAGVMAMPALAGCGQKGPLTLPAGAHAPSGSASAASAPAR